VVYVRAEGPKALSPEQWIQAARPEGAKLLFFMNLPYFFIAKSASTMADKKTKKKESS